MRITYWVAKCLKSPKRKRYTDAHSIRGKIRQVVEERLKEENSGDYAHPKMVTTPEFNGSFDMLEQCLGEKGPWWEEDDRVFDD
jgi:hypothetical protein